MKCLFSCILLLFTVGSFAQTKIIAHKSHSGKPGTFQADGPDNFGLSPDMYRRMRLGNLTSHTVKITAITDTQFVFERHVPRYNDTTYVFVDTVVQLDTLYSHFLLENPDSALSEFRKAYPEAELVGFDKKIIKEKSKKKKNQIIPPLGFQGPAGLTVLLILVFSSLTGYFIWKKQIGLMSS